MIINNLPVWEAPGRQLQPSPLHPGPFPPPSAGAPGLEEGAAGESLLDPLPRLLTSEPGSREEGSLLTPTLTPTPTPGDTM